jgi:hypothetical protein
VKDILAANCNQLDVIEQAEKESSSCKPEQLPSEEELKEPPPNQG